MARSRYYERKRKCLDEVKELMMRNRLLAEATREEPDLKPIVVSEEESSIRRILRIDRGKRFIVVLTPETAHAGLLS
jgi:hypothetical protein